MRYKIDIERIKEDMGSKKSFVHETEGNIKVMPYKTKYYAEAQEVKTLVGEVSRRCVKKVPDKKVDYKTVIKNIKEKVDSDRKEELIAFIEALYFDKQGHLELFHPKVFTYLEDATCGKQDQKRIGKYLYDALFKDISEEQLDQAFNQGGDLMVQLITSALPDLKEVKDEEGHYTNYAPYVKTVFEEDMTFIMKDHKRFIKCFDKLLEYYYFYYTSQAIIKLNQRQYADLTQLTPLYFRLSSEKGGKNRRSYLQGYRLLKEAIEVLFANVMLIQFLSYNEYEPNEMITSISQWYETYIKTSTQEEQEVIAKDIEAFITYYQEAVDKLDWNKLEVNYRSEDTVVDKAILRLFESIAYQFKVGTRKRAADIYKSWFTNYCMEHYLERRGNLGYMLTVEDHDIIFMTGICIKDQDKMRLSDLFTEFERRGLFFDDLSKEKIVAIYEKSNLLEKKSDSGDAQYVRSIL